MNLVGGGGFGSCYFSESYFGQGCGVGVIGVEPEPEVEEDHRIGGFYIIPVFADRRGANVYPDGILLVSTFGNAHVEIPAESIAAGVRFRLEIPFASAGGGSLILVRSTAKRSSLAVCNTRIRGIKNPSERELAILTCDYW